MKYEMNRTEDNYMEYHILEGTAYIGFIVLGGSGLRVDKVEEGEHWREGVGEEVCVIAESEEEAWAHMRQHVLGEK